jgi:hypothetical protein
MILSFMEKFPWKTPTNFEYKINNGIKIHTFLADEKNRWKPGTIINFYTGNYRKGKRKNFAPDGLCKNVEWITLENVAGMLVFETRNHRGDIVTTTEPWFFVRLAKNDGFDSVEDLKRYFVPNLNDFWRGKCLHFTDLSYFNLLSAHIRASVNRPPSAVYAQNHPLNFANTPKP